jgi:DtxR family Mn-dependent transcriptional regulator
MTEEMPGKSSEDYLEAILMLHNEKGSCRSVDIVEKLGFSKPSVSIAMKKLESEGYITRTDNGQINLTDIGMDIAEKTLEKHEFLKDMLESAGVEAGKAEEEACLMEHDISEDTFQKIRHAFHRQDAALQVE